MHFAFRIAMTLILGIGCILYPWYIALPAVAIAALGTGHSELLFVAILLDTMDAVPDMIALKAVAIVAVCVFLGKVCSVQLWRQTI